jgi:hypothetical protein
MNPIYTAGYGGHVARSLVLAARQLDALVIDIRHSPRSKNPGYDQKELIGALDSRYHHLPQLGNVNYGGQGAIQLANAEEGIRRVLEIAHARTVILMCGCGEFSGCHRATVAQLLAMKGVSTEELTWPPVPTLNLKGLPDVALSILQPWAWLICNGWKTIENREWSHPHRGPFLIHTGKGFDKEAHAEFMNDPEWRRRMPKIGDFDRGGIVGMATMTACVDWSTNEWFYGPYGFELKDTQPLPFMALRGAPKFFSVAAQLEAMKAPKKEKSEAGTVYVDELKTYDHGPTCFREGACHMTADTLEALHAMARRLGLKEEWFQSKSRLPHYDLTTGKREAALKAGAVFKPAKEQMREHLQKEKATV